MVSTGTYAPKVTPARGLAARVPANAVVAVVIAIALRFWREADQRPPDTLSTAPDT